ncbi:hypothetical protein HA402_007102 [Bradysia odoriphaga]|nr:hypothetical protein HA402_007102 [Bradysia odoriphaga]
MECWIPKLLLATKNFNGQTLVEWNAVESRTDFGFMSSIYVAQMITSDGEIEHHHDLIIKVMKGSEKFRQSSQSYVQFRNEIFFYDKLFPHFHAYLLNKANAIDLSHWLPKTYLSIRQIDETVLVQENVQKVGFDVEQTLYLTEDHLNLMIECLAQFHAVSLAQKLENGKEFIHLLDGIQPLCFEQPNGLPSMYDVLHEISTTRLFDFAFSQGGHDGQFLQDMHQLKRVVGDKPVKLLDRFRKIDDFAVIGHGDYHRNNVLFKKVNNNCVADMKMIDFQQLRYGSPCLDLSFFMYLNISADSRDSLWDEMLQKYHQQLVKHVAGILHISTNDPSLTCYSYDKFLQHCREYFLYGALISASFTPWLLTNKSETEKVVHLFQTDMFDQEYRRFALAVGGEAANRRILDNMIHASRQGYMEMLYNC